MNLLKIKSPVEEQEIVAAIKEQTNTGWFLSSISWVIILILDYTIGAGNNITWIFRGAALLLFLRGASFWMNVSYLKGYLNAIRSHTTTDR